MRKQKRLKSWMGAFGLLGALGFLYFVFRDPFFTTFFCFFGGFSIYWEAKLAKEMQDERLVENRYKASKIALQSVFIAVFCIMILIGNVLGSTNPAKAYVILNATIAIAFAAILNLSAFLTYKFDKGE